MPEAEESSDILEEGGVEEAREASSSESRVPFGFNGFKEAYGWRDIAVYLISVVASCLRGRVRGGSFNFARVTRA